MPSRSLTDLLTVLYQRMHGADPDPDVVTAVRRLRIDNGLADERRIPTWLIEALEALVDRREVDRVRFSRVGDVSNLAAELVEIVPGWQCEDVGEWLVATFPVLGVELVISREALDAEGRSCCSYSVRPCRVPELGDGGLISGFRPRPRIR